MGSWLPETGFLKKAVYIYGQRLAMSRVSEAIKKGVLLPPKTFCCDDCAEPATMYDHRDYNKPLEVAPVCRSCNYQRGSGVTIRNLPKSSNGAVHKLRDKLEADRNMKFQRHMLKHYNLPVGQGSYRTTED